MKIITSKAKYIFFFTFTIILILSALTYMPFIADDALITLRYVNRFIEGMGLTWNDNIRVEGYSNLLWALLISSLGYWGLDLVLVVRLLGFLFSISSLFLITNYIFKNHRNSAFIIATIVLSFFSFSSVISVWTIAGLEQPLFCFLVLLSAISYMKYRNEELPNYLLVTSTSLGLLSVTRPDGLLFAFVFILSHIYSYRKKDNKIILKEVIKISTFPAFFFSAQLIFRIIYYNELVPNTALVKLSPSIPHFIDGVMYNLRFFKSNFSLTLTALFSAIVLIREKDRKIFFYLFLISSWLLYICIIGGDIFVAFRHHYVTILIFLLIIADGLFLILNKLSIKNNRTIIFSAFFLILLSYNYQQLTNTNYTVVRLLNWHWETKTLSEELKILFKDRSPLIAVDAAGSLPYWTGFPAIDMLGLNDYHIARHKTAKVGKGQIGHELGDVEYVLDKNPDIIQVHISYEVPIHYADSLLFRNRRFKEQYRKVGLKVEGDYNYKGVLWFNRNSDLVGVDSNRKRMIIPAYLLKASKTIYSEFNQNHRIITPITYLDTLSYIINSKIVFKQITTFPKREGLKFDIISEGNATTVTLTNRSMRKIYIENIIINY